MLMQTFAIVTRMTFSTYGLGLLLAVLMHLTNITNRTVGMDNMGFWQEALGDYMKEKGHLK